MGSFVQLLLVCMSREAGMAVTVNETVIVSECIMDNNRPLQDAHGRRMRSQGLFTSTKSN